jgi:hypothetical protein
MRRAAAALALLMLLTQGAQAGEKAMTLVLPHPLRAGESAWIEVHVGPIQHGRQIDVATASGEQLGRISPYGVRPGNDAGTYTLPVPPGAIRDGRISIRLTISQFGGPPRTANANEVHGVKLVVTTEQR